MAFSLFFLLPPPLSLPSCCVRSSFHRHPSIITLTTFKTACILVQCILYLLLIKTSNKSYSTWIGIGMFMFAVCGRQLLNLYAVCIIITPWSILRCVNVNVNVIHPSPSSSVCLCLLCFCCSSRRRRWPLSFAVVVGWFRCLAMPALVAVRRFRWSHHHHYCCRTSTKKWLTQARGQHLSSDIIL